MKGDIRVCSSCTDGGVLWLLKKNVKCYNRQNFEVWSFNRSRIKIHYGDFAIPCRKQIWHRRLNKSYFAKDMTFQECSDRWRCIPEIRELGLLLIELNNLFIINWIILLESIEIFCKLKKKPLCLWNVPKKLVCRCLA